MAAFNLTAQLQLQAPGNVAQVISGIKKQLAPIGIQVNVVGNTRSLAQINQQLQNTTKYAKSSARSVGELNRTLQESARRFSVITIATGTLLGFVSAVKNSIKEAIAFEKAMVNLSQITGKTTDQLQPLADEVTRLSTSLGVSSTTLINASQVLAQAGFSAETTKKALDILAKTTLASSFGDITDTTEGAIAALAQFTDVSASTATQIQFLESTLDAINAVSKAFAVESSDLVTVIRRTGGVFAAAGGSVEELIALFTSVRATTRESAETIATGLRTIFTRIQRPETIDLLKQLGIQLQDSEGKFVGAFEAVKRLSAGLSALDPRDFRFSQIVEELGGFRQIGKVIPLIQQFTIAQDALNVAQSASGSVAADALIAQQSLANQIAKVREEFDALIRRFTASETFRSLAGGALELASAFIKIAEALEPVLPLLTSLFALKLGAGIAPAIASFAGIGGAAKGGAGRISKFARGGVVPGSGSGDTVPAMLTPGEFVIRKSSVKKLGTGTLSAMNENKFKDGIQIRENLARPETVDPKQAEVGKLKLISALTGSAKTKAEKLADTDTYGAAFLRPGAGGVYTGETEETAQAIKSSREYGIIQAIAKKTGIKPNQEIIKQTDDIINSYTKNNKFKLVTGSLSGNYENKIEDTILQGVYQTVQNGVKTLDSDLKIQQPADIALALKRSNIDQVVGNIFESIISFTGQPYSDTAKDSANAPYDFPKGIGDLVSKFGFASSEPQTRPTDTKTSFTSDALNTFISKTKNQNVSEAKKELLPLIQNLAQQFGQETTLTKETAQRLFGEKKTTEAAKKYGINLTEATKNKYSLAGSNAYAKGGSVKSDTVPALLTPGEFVVNKKAASKIGYGNLGRMNKTGVAHFAKGGAVGIQRFAPGGKAQAAFAGGGSNLDLGQLGLNQNTLKTLDSNLATYSNTVSKVSALISSQGDNSVAAKAAISSLAASIRAGVNESDALVAAEKSAISALNTHNAAMKNVASGANNFLNTALKAGPDLVKNLQNITKDPKQRTEFAQSFGVRSDAIPKGVADPKAILSQIQSNLAQGFKNIGLSSQDLQKALKQTEQDLLKGKNATVAFANAVKTYAVEAAQNATKATPGLLSRAKQTISQGASDFGAGFSGGIQGSANIAGAVQNIVFLGSAVSALTGQMSGLSDVQKQAINETAGFAIAITGISSTLISTLGSIANSSNSSQVAASNQQLSSSSSSASTQVAALGNAATTTSQKLAGVGAGGGTGGGVGGGGAGPGKMTKFGDALGQAIGPAVAAFALVTTAMTYFAAKARAEADAIAKAREQMLKDLQEKGIGDNASIASSFKEEAKLRQQASDIDQSKWAAGGVAAVTAGFATVALSSTAAGAALGSSVPVIGTLIGAVAGAIVGWAMYTKLQADAAKKQEDLNKKIDEASNSYVGLIQSSQRFDAALKDLDVTNISEKEKVSRRVSASKELGNQPLASGQRAIKELSRLSRDAAGGKAANVKATGGLTKEDFKESAGNAVLLEIAQKELAQATQDAAKKTIEARNTLARAGKLELETGLRQGKSFEQIAGGTTDYANALRDLIGSIRQEFELKILQVKVDRELLEIKLAGTTEPKERERLAAAIKSMSQQEQQLTNRRNKQIEDVNKSEQQAAEATKKMIIEEERAAAAARALAAELEYNQSVMKSLSDFGDALDKQSSEIDRQSAIFNNQSIKAEGPKVSEIKDPTKVSDRGKFNKQVDIVTSRFGDAGKAVANKLKLQGDFIDRASKGLQDPTIGKLGENIKPDEILNRFGLNAANAEQIFGARGKEIFEGIKSKLFEAAKDGKITEDEIKGIIGPAADLMQAEGKTVEEMIALVQKEIDQYESYLKRLDDYRNRELEGAARMANVLAKAADIMANATGKPQNIDAKEAARTVAAQRQLNISGAGAAGARAGNVASLQKARNEALGGMEETSKIIKSDTADIATRKAAMKEYEKQKAIVQSVNAELERLGDQSERVADIQSEIEKERGKRETMFGLLEEYVVGGEDQRNALDRAANGIMAAVKTGTLQNQTPEQRKETVSLLDKLKDIQIPGAGGLTGKQVKQELVFRDAIRAGFPPQLAKEIATATSKEEQLIDALDRLTKTMIDATAARNELGPMPEAPPPVDFQQPKPAPAAPAPVPAAPGAGTTAPPAPTPAGGVTPPVAGAPTAAPAVSPIIDLTAVVSLLTSIDSKLTPPLQVVIASAPTPVGAASGGLISYLDDGGESIFKPKGTDTVPAMLTPGEFVIRKSAVDKVGVSTLEAINSGKTDTLYRQAGGMVPINSMNAITGDKVNILSGDQYKAILKDAMRMKPGLLVGLFRRGGFKKEADAIQQLIKTNRFSPDRFNLGSNTSKALDTFRGNSSLFNTANAYELTLKDPTVGFQFGDSTYATYERFIGLIKRWNDALGTISSIKIDGPYSDIESQLLKASKMLPIKDMTQMAQGKIAGIYKFIQEQIVNSFDLDKILNKGRQPTDDASVDINNAIIKLKQVWTQSNLSPTKSEQRELKIPERKQTATDKKQQEAEDFLKERGLYLSGGGYVSYLSDGGNGMPSKGTDTVPAMLTPGEFVVRKSAVNKIGVQNLEAINRGIPVYRAIGGMGGVYKAPTSSDVEAGKKEARIQRKIKMARIADNFARNPSAYADEKQLKDIELLARHKHADLAQQEYTQNRIAQIGADAFDTNQSINFYESNEKPINDVRAKANEEWNDPNLQNKKNQIMGQMYASLNDPDNSAYSLNNASTQILLEELAKDELYTIASILPLIGDGIAIEEILSGRNLRTGEELAWWDYAINVLSLIPLAGDAVKGVSGAAKAGKAALRGAEATAGAVKAVDAATGVAKTADVTAGAAKTAETTASSARSASATESSARTALDEAAATKPATKEADELGLAPINNPAEEAAIRAGAAKRAGAQQASQAAQNARLGSEIAEEATTTATKEAGELGLAPINNPAEEAAIRAGAARRAGAQQAGQAAQNARLSSGIAEDTGELALRNLDPLEEAATVAARSSAAADTLKAAEAASTSAKTAETTTTAVKVADAATTTKPKGIIGRTKAAVGKAAEATSGLLRSRVTSATLRAGRFAFNTLFPNEAQTPASTTGISADDPDNMPAAAAPAAAQAQVEAAEKEINSAENSAPTSTPPVMPEMAQARTPLQVVRELIALSKQASMLSAGDKFKEIQARSNMAEQRKALYSELQSMSNSSDTATSIAAKQMIIRLGNFRRWQEAEQSRLAKDPEFQGKERTDEVKKNYADKLYNEDVTEHFLTGDPVNGKKPKQLIKNQNPKVIATLLEGLKERSLDTKAKLQYAISSADMFENMTNNFGSKEYFSALSSYIDEELGTIVDSVSNFNGEPLEGGQDPIQAMRGMKDLLAKASSRATIFPSKVSTISSLIDQIKQFPEYDQEQLNNILSEQQAASIIFDRQNPFDGIDNYGGVIANIKDGLNELYTELVNTTAKVNQPQDKTLNNQATGEALAAANGGIVYRARGGSIFKPKGTDTVPAMLSPGEFVIRKSAVDKIGVGTLSAINNGSTGFARGGVVYAADGYNAKKEAGKKAELAFIDMQRKKKEKDDAMRARSGMTAVEINKERKAAAENNPPKAKQEQQQQQQRQQQVEQNQAQIAQRQQQFGALGGTLGAQGVAKVAGAQNVGLASLMDMSSKYVVDTITKNVSAMINPLSQQIANLGGGANAAGGQPLAGGPPLQEMVVNAATGGLIPSYLYYGGRGKRSNSDTIPAMLTPGEFVMSAGAVKKHGVETMRALNKGEIPGFNKGGSVGGVSYLARGGRGGGGGSSFSVDVDTSSIQGVFQEFITNVSTTFGAITSPFNTLAASLDNFVNTMTGFEFTHNVEVSGLITLGGLNIDSVAKAITGSIQTMVTDQINSAIANNNANLGNKPNP